MSPWVSTTMHVPQLHTHATLFREIILWGESMLKLSEFSCAPFKNAHAWPPSMEGAWYFPCICAKCRYSMIRCHFHFRTTPMSFECHEWFSQYCLLLPAAVKQTQVPSQALFHNGPQVVPDLACPMCNSTAVHHFQGDNPVMWVQIPTGQGTLRIIAPSLAMYSRFPEVLFLGVQRNNHQLGYGKHSFTFYM